MVSIMALLIAMTLGFASCQEGMGETGSTSQIVSGQGANASVSGTVSYRERLALTPGATVKVELRDVSYADAPAPLIASQTISNPGQVPIEFRVEYNRDDIDPRNTYGISARITESDGRLAFINDTAYDVITRGNPSSVDMLLVLAQPPSDGEWEGKDDEADWRTWVELPAQVISANLLPNEAEPLLRIVYLQSTIEGCARPGNKAGELDGSNINVRLTLMQPPKSSWAIPCDEEMVELDEVLPVPAPLKPGTLYRVVVNGLETAAFTPPDPALGRTYIAGSLIQSANIKEIAGEPGGYLLRVVSGRPSGSCTQYNGYEVVRHDPTSIEVRITHHHVADREVMCTKDFPMDETIVPLRSGFESGVEGLITVNGRPLSSYKPR